MFAKSYKLKSNNTLKNSEKKHLALRIQSEYPNATDLNIKELLPSKSNTSCMKLIVHSGDTVGVYVVDNFPIMIDLGEKLIPTVCALWKIPNLIPTISIANLVLSKIQNGAPLYAPGVITNANGFPTFASGTVIAVCTSGNAAAAVVGFALMSSADLLRAPMGLCLETLHVFGDQLCKEAKFVKIERPTLEPVSYDISDDITTDINQLTVRPVKEEWPSLVKREPATPAAVPPAPLAPPAAVPPAPLASPATPALVPPAPSGVEMKPGEVEVSEDSNESGATEEDAAPRDMDGLLRWCLLCFLKFEAKNVELPLKTSLLYRNHLMPYCPEDRTLDVKKSSYRKTGKFLEAMEREGLLRVREVERGVAALVAVDARHAAVRGLRAPRPAPRPASASPRAAWPRAAPQVRELHCVTADVAPLFAPLKKGAALPASDVRAALVRYVRARELDARPPRGAVRLDESLARATGAGAGEALPWEELTRRVLARMTAGSELRLADGSVELRRARLEPVAMRVVTRSGNKKVTLVSNLESFGLALAPLARACQLGVGAACGVTRSPGARADELMLQGDQTHFVAKLLIEKYGLPKKFLEGADKALNKKK